MVFKNKIYKNIEINQHYFYSTFTKDKLSLHTYNKMQCSSTKKGLADDHRIRETPTYISI